MRSAIFKSLLAAWFTIVFGSSLLIVLFTAVKQEVYSANPVLNFLRQWWEVADEVGPVVKIIVILLFTLFVYVFRRYLLLSSGIAPYLNSVLLAVIAIFLVLLFLPENYSRGFGIGLTGKRVDLHVLPLYMLGAIMGGAAFIYTYRLSSGMKT